MANYSRIEGNFLNNRYSPLPITKEIFCRIFLFLLAFLPAVLSCPGYASGMDKVAVLPFRIESTEPAENLGISLQEMFSQYMKKMGYQVVNTDMINAILGDSISFSDPEKKIIPFGKANSANWIIMGEITEKEGSIQLNVKALDPDSAKIPFSVMMVEKDSNNLPEAIKKIAESLNTQIKEHIVISDIIVKGSKRASEEAILNIIESQKGDQFDQEKLDRDLRTIYKMGFFDDVYHDETDSPEGKIITFNLVEKPTIIKITFEGNKRKKEDKLMEELGIKKYSVLDRSEIKQSINRLLEFYRNDGYYNVDIKAQIKNLEDENEVILTYVIDEGEKVFITQINFNGNKVFDDDDLKDVMLTKEKGWLTWLTDAGVLDKKKLEYDLHNLRMYYDNHGYINAQVGEPKITYDEKDEGLTLTITVTEENQYKVNDIIIEGDLLVPVDDIKKVFHVKKGDIFSQQVIYTEKDNIVNLYADYGYAYAEVFFSKKEIEGTNLVDIILRIQKNKRVRVERINIFGNEITKDKVFRRELKLAEGEYYSRTKLEKSKENLDRIQIFEDHEAKIRKGSSDDLMVIDIEGKEQLRRSISFSAGYGGYEKFMFQLQYANNNLFGRGQNLSLDAMVGNRTTSFNISVQDPWLFDKPVRGSITLYSMDMEYDYYTRKRIGGGAGIGFLLGLDDYTRGTLNYSYDKSKYTDSFYYEDDIVQNNSTVLTSSATIGIERNSKDKWWDTTKGSLNYFTYEYAGGLLGGDSAFNKYILSSTWYLPVVWKTVFVIKAELGLVQRRSDGYLPHYEKFFLGGIDSVRGYEAYSITPLNELGYQLGGTRKWLYKLEYRIPFGKSKGVTGLIFMDAGNAFNKHTSWKTGAGASVGLGIRWYSPMGPMRLEYGYKLKENLRDPDSGRFEFTVSNSY